MAFFKSPPIPTALCLFFLVFLSSQISEIRGREILNPTFPRVSKAHGFSSPQNVPSDERTFNNPILDIESGDPQAILIDGFYYLIFTHWGGFFRLYKSPTLTNFRNAEIKDVATIPEGQVEIWAPEILMIRGELYIYYNSMPAGNPGGRRNYAIKADDPKNPFGTWGAPIMIAPEFDYISIDGSVLQHGSKLYFAWATLVDTEWGRNPLQIYIAEMSDATTVVGEKKLLRKPTADWECQGGCTNEGPFFIYNRNVSYMIFSASSTWSPSYSLGMMSIPFDKDPMNIDNWDFGGDGPVFWRNDEEQVYTTGHAAFVQSKDGKETWMTYHQTLLPEGDIRIASIEKITWDEQTGRPVFPRPHGRFHPLPLPSGEF